MKNINRYLILISHAISCNTITAQNKTIDVQHYKFEISLNDTNNIIYGKATINLKTREAGNTVYFDLKNFNDSTGNGMKVLQVSENNKDLKFSQNSDRVSIYFNKAWQLNVLKNITISYSGIPSDGLIIDTNKFARRTFFADNWPNRSHNWIPCNDHPSDKASVEFIVTAPDHYRVIANGILVEESNLTNHLKRTHWKEDLLLPTKVMVIGVADFAVQLVARINGIPVTSWVFPENKDSGFAQYAIAKNILPFYMDYIGPYPYKKLASVQSKTVFGGMENASNIFYYQNSVKTDSVSHEDYISLEGLFAHEEAHQWFGDEASETDWQHVWLSEGFATYMTHLYFEHRYGEDSLKRRMQADREKVIGFYKKRKTPVVDNTSGNNILQLLNENSYQKGSWILHMLRRKLGNALFQKGLRTYYTTYKGKNASTKYFEKVLENASKQNLQVFFKQWLYTPGHPVLQGKWHYDSDKKILAVNINQIQDFLFQFPLQIAVKENEISNVKTFQISKRTTSINISFNKKPQSIQLDPGVNLLFEGNVKEDE